MAYQESTLTDEQIAKREAGLREITDAREARWEANREVDTIGAWRSEDTFSDFLEDNNGFDWDE